MHYMSKTARRILISLGGLTALFVALAVTGLIVLRFSSSVSGPLVARFLSGTTGLEVTIGGIELGYFPMRLDLKRVLFKAPGPGATRIYAERVRVLVNPWSLFARGRPLVRRLVLDRPQVILDTQGKDADPGSQLGRFFEILVGADRVTVKGGALRILHPGRELSLDRLEILKGEPGVGREGYLFSGRLRLMGADPKRPLISVNLRSKGRLLPSRGLPRLEAVVWLGGLVVDLPLVYARVDDTSFPINVDLPVVWSGRLKGRLPVLRLKLKRPWPVDLRLDGLSVTGNLRLDLDQGRLAVSGIKVFRPGLVRLTGGFTVFLARTQPLRVSAKGRLLDLSRLGALILPYAERRLDPKSWLAGLTLKGQSDFEATLLLTHRRLRRLSVRFFLKNVEAGYRGLGYAAQARVRGGITIDGPPERLFLSGRLLGENGRLTWGGLRLRGVSFELPFRGEPDYLKSDHVSLKAETVRLAMPWITLRPDNLTLAGRVLLRPQKVIRLYEFKITRPGVLPLTGRAEIGLSADRRTRFALSGIDLSQLPLWAGRPAKSGPGGWSWSGRVALSGSLGKGISGGRELALKLELAGGTGSWGGVLAKNVRSTALLRLWPAVKGGVGFALTAGLEGGGLEHDRWRIDFSRRPLGLNLAGRYSKSGGRLALSDIKGEVSSPGLGGISVRGAAVLGGDWPLNLVVGLRRLRLGPLWSLLRTRGGGLKIAGRVDGRLALRRRGDLTVQGRLRIKGGELVWPPGGVSIKEARIDLPLAYGWGRKRAGWPRPRAVGRFTIGRFMAPGVKPTSVSGRVTLRPGRLTLAPFRLPLLGGRATIGPVRVLRPFSGDFEVHTRAKVKDFRLGRLAALLNLGEAKGSASAHIRTLTLGADKLKALRMTVSSRGGSIGRLGIMALGRLGGLRLTPHRLAPGWTDAAFRSLGFKTLIKDGLFRLKGTLRLRGKLYVLIGARRGSVDLISPPKPPRWRLGSVPDKLKP